MVVKATANSELEFTNSSVVRTIRILRGIKVIRLVRFIRYAEELQLIVSCLILSFRTFLWSIGLLVMTFYVMAIYTTQVSYLYRLEFPDSSVNPALEKWWGGIFTSMLSVLQALSGGVDWNDILQPLIAVSPTLLGNGMVWQQQLFVHPLHWLLFLRAHECYHWDVCGNCFTPSHRSENAVPDLAGTKGLPSDRY